MRIHTGLALVGLTGCFGSPVVGEWDLDDFGRFQIDESSYSTFTEQADLRIDGAGNKVDMEFDFDTNEFGRLVWDLAGNWDGAGGGTYVLEVDGPIKLVADKQNAEIQIAGTWVCLLDKDALACDGAMSGREEDYTFEVGFVRR